MAIHSQHLQIIFDLDKLTQNKHNSKESAWVQHYLGSNKPTRCLKSKDIGVLVKKYEPSLDLINSLYQNGISSDEIFIGASLVGRLKPLMDLNLIDNWLKYCVGWAEVDTLCQSNFSAIELLSNWSAWKKFLLRLSDDKNISHRRASLVLLCKSLRQSDDQRLYDLGIFLVDKLKFEKEILITKAVSWLLRSMVKFHPDELAVYLEDNRDTLPKIAYREAYRKLTTGKKS